MARHRLLLHDLLKEITPNVYFQPPTEVVYPCIIYEVDDEDAQFANNLKYVYHNGYQLQVIDPDPDGNVRKKVARLPLCSFSRSYTADNLNHYVYNLFF